MINFEKQTLANGLTVIVHQDNSTPMATVNMLYKVGSRNEQPDKTGFAHLFEHLMFGGSVNAPSYDQHVQMAGGECNAFTTADFTNYYVTLPSQNIETALWLESDRLLNPLLNEKILNVQRNVVVEEFNQRYLNQPYGDVQLLLKPLAYKVHPYQWNTIGKSIDHIATATLSDVQAFFKKFYTPGNAILVLAGNIEPQNVFTLAKKWFEDIPGGEEVTDNIPVEPKQTESRTQSVERNVPASAIYKAYHMPARMEPGYHACDLTTDILSNGKSSRLYRKLVQEQALFSNVNAYISGDIDAGLIVATGHLLPHVNMPQAEAALQQELSLICSEKVSDYELEKVKNKVESMHVFSETAVMQKAVALACAQMLGNINLVNSDIESYRKVTAEEMQQVSESIFKKENCSTLYYNALQK
ncbi:MAG: insulinase family protein [Prevotellaceae bacterium]|jgi:predicted Zn-dependent peptidase|nr:insulinase family protein [Prevotellaceae bacterium]